MNLVVSASEDSVAELVKRIRTHEGAIRAFGVARLSIFGSRARGSAPPTSDLDLIAGFAKGRKGSYFDLARVKLLLEDSLHVRVDILPESAASGSVNRFGESLRAF